METPGNMGNEARKVTYTLIRIMLTKEENNWGGMAKQKLYT